MYTQSNTLYLLNSTDNVVNGHMFEKTKFSFTSWLCDVPVDVNEKSVFIILQFYNNYHFSGSKRPWLMHKFCLLRFSIFFQMVSFLSSLMH